MLACQLCGAQWEMLFYVDGKAVCIDCCPPERREPLLAPVGADDVPPGLGWAWPQGVAF